ncbi:hypothetical protein [Ruminococcus flavefaciens]|uniref:hypothetical protein n=1 Tax=Ruminococcus flavefaciens TaxID=1265 RepID=UPI0004642A20|nr:hypothetical protein [Ruminococcus flavefaciens]
MKNNSLKAVLAASMLLFTLCSCTDPYGVTPPSSEISTTEASANTVLTEKVSTNAKYENGSYSGEGFSLYADPNIWRFIGSQSDAPYDLQLITDKDINTCGISVYVSDDDHGGKSAQNIVMEANNSDIIFTGAAATAAMTFYYYEWAIDDETHGRTYFADYGDNKYLCAYAESNNFGYMDGKITDLLSSIKLTENNQ